jgi:tRNA-binding protein
MTSVDAEGNTSAEAISEISVEEFLQAEIRVGKVLRVELFPEARIAAYKIWMDFGELGVKKSSARVTGLYSPLDLVGKSLVAVTNLAPRQVANFISEVLVLGVPISNQEVVLLQPERDVPAGTRVL